MSLEQWHMGIRCVRWSKPVVSQTQGKQVLNISSDWFGKFAMSCFPVDTTDELNILMELELTREGGLHMESTFIDPL